MTAASFDDSAQETAADVFGRIFLLQRSVEPMLKSADRPRAIRPEL
jgi:hypothetical protein